MTPERAPTVSQLLAFYLEAGVDCALAEEPLNRLADPEKPADLKASVPSGDVVPPRPYKRTSAALVTPASEAPLAPDAAIATAREAAGTASSLVFIRGMLEK